MIMLGLPVPGAERLQGQRVLVARPPQGAEGERIFLDTGRHAAPGHLRLQACGNPIATGTGAEHGVHMAAARPQEPAADALRTVRQTGHQVVVRDDRHRRGVVYAEKHIQQGHHSGRRAPCPPGTAPGSAWSATICEME